MLTAVAMALWLGIQTSISPCPLAMNIAAISYIASSGRRALLAGFMYTLGCTAAYVGVGVAVMSLLQSSHWLSTFLQRYAPAVTGPVLIVVGMLLVGLLRSGRAVHVGDEATRRKLAGGGPVGAAGLGVLFALSFCPLSAALFFTSLLGLAAAHGSRVLLPLLFGVGMAVPVIVFALIVAFAAKSLAPAFNRLRQFDRWSRRVTGTVIILVGVYMCLKYIWGL